MKIGLLYPRSQAHPGLLGDFADGIKTSLQYHQLNPHVQLIAESIGYGGQEKEVYEKIEKLLILEGADILVAFIDLRILEIVKPILYTSGKLIIVVNPGANYPDNWIPQSNIINLTLQHSFLSWLTGKMAAQCSNKNAVTVTSFYDCGYLHMAAIVKGFTKQAGQIKYNYVNNQRYDDAFEIKQLTDYLVSDKETSTLLCILDSQPAALLYSCLYKETDVNNLHLFVSPMMLEQPAIEKIGDGFNFSIDGYLPWHTNLENNANKEFRNNYHLQTKREVGIFSLLGWEIGLIVKEILLQSNESYADGTEIAQKLGNAKINSPRGELKLDTDTNYYITPVYKYSIPKNTPKPLIEIVEMPESEWKTFVETPDEGVSSGWTNTYLCY